MNGRASISLQWITVHTPKEECPQLGDLWWKHRLEAPAVSFSHLCNCASAFLICPQVPSCYLPPKVGTLFWTTTHSFNDSEDCLFCFQSLPSGSRDPVLEPQPPIGNLICKHRTPLTTKVPLIWLKLWLYLEICCCIRSCRALDYYNAAPQEVGWGLFK